MNKLEYINKEIESLKPFNKYMKQAIKERKQFYKDKASLLEAITLENIKKYSFRAEVLKRAEVLEKFTFTPKLLDKITKLETHEYSPEQNKLHFKNTYISVPQAKTIADAIAQIIQNNSITSIIKLNLEL